MFDLASHLAHYGRAALGRSERGSSLVEYVLLLALIAVVCLLALTYLGEATNGRMSTMASQVASS